MRSQLLQSNRPAPRIQPGPMACVSYDPAFGNGDHPHYGL